MVLSLMVSQLFFWHHLSTVSRTQRTKQKIIIIIIILLLG